MKSLCLLNFLIVLNLTNLTGNLGAFDRVSDIVSETGVIGTTSNTETGHTSAVGTGADTRANLSTVGTVSASGAGSGAGASAESAGYSFAGARAGNDGWGCSYRVSSAGARSSADAEHNIPDTYVVSFGSDDTVSAGSAKDAANSCSPASPAIARDLVSDTGRITGLLASIEELVGLDPERKPVPAMDVRNLGQLPGFSGTRVARPKSADPRTRFKRASGIAGVAVDVLATISESPVHRVRARSDSSPVAQDPMRAAVIMLAGAAERSSAAAAEQVIALQETNRLHAAALIELKQQAVARIAERARVQAMHDAELAEEVAYARTPFCKRRCWTRPGFEQRVLNWAGLTLSFVSGTVAATALYTQNHPQ